MHRVNKCDGCGAQLAQGQRVVALIPEVEVVLNKTNNTNLRLKLSLDAIDVRALKIYCQKCLDLSQFEHQDGV